MERARRSFTEEYKRGRCGGVARPLVATSFIAEPGCRPPNYGGGTGATCLRKWFEYENELNRAGIQKPPGAPFDWKVARIGSDGQVQWQDSPE